MSNVINRSNKKYLKSVHTPDYSISEWIHNPSVPNCSEKYWKILGDLVVEMNSSEKITVDNNIIADIANKISDKKDITKCDKLLKSFALVMIDEINSLRSKTGLSPRTVDQLKTAIINKYDTL